MYISNLFFYGNQLIYRFLWHDEQVGVLSFTDCVAVAWRSSRSAGISKWKTFNEAISDLAVLVCVDTCSSACVRACVLVFVSSWM